MEVGGGIAQIDNDTLKFNDTGTIYNPYSKIVGVYTGNSFDSNNTTTNGTVTNNHTIQISADDLDGADYIVMFINLLCQVQVPSDPAVGDGNVALRIERNETGQSSWSDVLSEQAFCHVHSREANTDCDTNDQFACQTHIISLTDGEKSNGIDIRITTKAFKDNVDTGYSKIKNKGVFFITHKTPAVTDTGA